METAALCKPIQRFADLLRIPGTWVLTGLGKLLAALGSFPHFPQPLRLLHTHLYWRFLECQSIEVTLTQTGHLTHHEIPSVASLRPGGHFPRNGWPVSPEYAVGKWESSQRAKSHEGIACIEARNVLLSTRDPLIAAASVDSIEEQFSNQTSVTDYSLALSAMSDKLKTGSAAEQEMARFFRECSRYLGIEEGCPW